MTPADNERLLGWVPLMIRWRGLDRKEREFLISVRARHKRQPAMVLSEKQAAWITAILTRFQADTLTDDESEVTR